MHRAVILGAVVAALAALVVESASATPEAKITLCGQRSGPRTTYVTPLTKRKLSGSRWTVIATGVPCSRALEAAPAILRWWGKAAVGSSSSGTLAGGFTCTKERDGHGSSGSAGCVATKGAGQIVQLYMTGPYTISQLTKLFGG